MFLNPTMGTYQTRKVRMRRMTQVKTSSPIKILFFGLISNIILSSVQMPKSKIGIKTT